MYWSHLLLRVKRKRRQTSLVKTGTSAVTHMKENLERTLESTSEPLPESPRVMVQDGFLLVPGEFDAAFLKYAD